MKNLKPTFNKERPLSWSAISSFEFSKEQWYRKYVLGQEDPPSAEMLFGKFFAASCENRKPLAPVTLLSKMEHKFQVIFGGIPLIGYADTFDEVTKKRMGEYKTGKTVWTQKRVDEHGQLTLYCLMNFITEKIRPEDMEIFLESVQTKQEGDFSISLMEPVKVYHFKTKRTMADILTFGTRIKKVVEEMENYAKKHS